MVLSRQHDVLQLPSHDIIHSKENIQTLEQAISVLSSSLNIKTEIAPRILDVVYSCLDGNKELYLYYMAYVPIQSLIGHDKEYVLIDINNFVSNYMIRKFICMV